MGRIKDMKCLYCNKEHNYKSATDLQLGGWYGYGLSKAGTHCKFVICPDCLAQHFKRKIQGHEFREPRHRKQYARQGVLDLVEPENTKRVKYNGVKVAIDIPSCFDEIEPCEEDDEELDEW